MMIWFLFFLSLLLTYCYAMCLFFLFHYIKCTLFFFIVFYFFFSSRRRHTRCLSDWSSDVCSSDLSAQRRTVSADERSAHGGRSAGLSRVQDRLGLEAARRRSVDAADRPPGIASHPGRGRIASGGVVGSQRSEERRVGKEGRGGWRG